MFSIAWSSAHRRRCVAIAALLSAWAPVSGCASDTSVVHPPARKDDPGRGDPSIRVGNQAKGVDEQPDYDKEAEEIRSRVEGKLPEQLGTPAAACSTMFDAAIGAYKKSDGAGSRAAKYLESTRASDLVACEAETSPAAAACVSILITEDGGEFPWLLDQCSRAFPAS